MVSPTSLTIDEGSSASFTVALATQPSDTVTVTILHPGTPLGTISPTSLTFTTSTWSTPQTVTVSADEDPDGVHNSGSSQSTRRTDMLTGSVCRGR